MKKFEALAGLTKEEYKAALEKHAKHMRPNTELPRKPQLIAARFGKFLQQVELERIKGTSAPPFWPMATTGPAGDQRLGTQPLQMYRQLAEVKNEAPNKNFGRYYVMRFADVVNEETGQTLRDEKGRPIQEPRDFRWLDETPYVTMGALDTGVREDLRRHLAEDWGPEYLTSVQRKLKDLWPQTLLKLLYSDGLDDQAIISRIKRAYFKGQAGSGKARSSAQHQPPRDPREVGRATSSQPSEVAASSKPSGSATTPKKRLRKTLGPAKAKRPRSAFIDDEAEADNDTDDAGDDEEGDESEADSFVVDDE